MFLQFIPYIRIYFCILILPVYQSFHFILSFYSLSASSLFLVQPFFKTQFFNHQHHIVVVVGSQISNLKSQVIIIILPSIAKCINPFRRLIRFWHFQEVDFGFCSFSFNLRQFYFLISHRNSNATFCAMQNAIFCVIQNTTQNAAFCVIKMPHFEAYFCHNF